MEPLQKCKRSYQIGRMATQYSYEAVDRSEPSIRLLRFEQPSGNNDVHCSLRKETVDSASYVALSYMWHPDGQVDNAREVIRLDGRSFEVTKSLWSFLNIAQHKFPDTDFWIDAICIDQGNVMERNHQVAHMHEIYSSASSVLIWLGEGDSNTHMFFDLVNKGSWSSNFMFHGQQLLDPGGRMTSKPEPEEDLVLREGVYKMIRNPFWGRSWIVQELLLAKRIEIMMGSDRIDWGSFFGPMDIQEHAGAAESRAGGERMADVRLFRDNPDGMTAPKDLAGLISYFSRQECSDPRDRVYSLLGIANERNNFDVDYNSTLEQVAEYTLGRINFDNFLFALPVVDSLGISPLETSTKFTPSFLDKKFTEEQTAKYVEIRAVKKDSAETVDGVPEEWKLPTRKMPLTISRCRCGPCLSKASLLVPRNGDIVAELPQSGLMVLCRRSAARKSFDYIACVGQSRHDEIWGYPNRQYLCFALRDALGDLRAAPAKEDRSANSGGVHMLEWNLSWRTVFAISQHAHLGDVPGLVVLDGPEPHNTWKHDFQDKESAS